MRHIQLMPPLPLRPHSSLNQHGLLADWMQKLKSLGMQPQPLHPKVRCERSVQRAFAVICIPNERVGNLFSMAS